MNMLSKVVNPSDKAMTNEVASKVIVGGISLFLFWKSSLNISVVAFYDKK